MFDNTNPYTLRSEIIGGLTHYFVAFEDVENTFCETAISRQVYLEFLRFVKVERNLRRWDERHLEQTELTEEMLRKRNFKLPESVEDTMLSILENEKLNEAIQSLPETQRRRFVLYYEFGLNYEEIAAIENCTFQAVGNSIKNAKVKILNFFEN